MLVELSFSNIFTIAFLGILVYQFAISLFKYRLNKKKEYFYYTLYLMVLTINFISNYYLFLNKEAALNEYKILKSLLGYPINFAIQVLYLKFLCEYLHTKSNDFLLHKKITCLIYINILFGLISSIFSFIYPLFSFWANSLLNIANFILFCIPLYYVIKSKLLYYKFIVIGTICLGIGLVANLFLSIFQLGKFDYDIAIMIGMLIEIIIFNYALQLKIETQSKALLMAEIEKQKAIESEHRRVSADLHDEVGSTLSSIQILSVISKKKIDFDLQETKNLLQTIIDQSQKMQQSLSDIVWGLRTDLDSIEDIVVKIKNVLAQNFEPSNILYDIDVDDKILSLTLSVLERRNILLIFKEAINNILKYAEAKNVLIKIQKQNNYLNITIKDDGKGFDKEVNNKNGNGLKNIENRVKQIYATLQIQSSESKGTAIIINMPLKSLY